MHRRMLRRIPTNRSSQGRPKSDEHHLKVSCTDSGYSEKDRGMYVCIYELNDSICGMYRRDKEQRIQHKREEKQISFVALYRVQLFENQLLVVRLRLVFCPSIFAFSLLEKCRMVIKALAIVCFTWMSVASR